MIRQSLSFLVFAALLFSPLENKACNPPFLLAVSNITTSTATLTWTPLGTETEWDVAVVPRGAPVPVLPTLAGVMSFPVIHPGLAPAKAYDFYVRAVCDTLPGAWAKFNSFFITGFTNPSPCQVALQIPDEQCVDFKIWVDNAPGSQLGVDVYLKEVRVTIRHPWDDDIDLGLISPDGVFVDLSSDNGGSGDHYGNPNDALCQSFTTFVNELAPEACDLPSITQGTAPFIGKFRPEESLTLFHTGADPNAVWTLRVCDDAQNDVGRLEFVELVFAPLVCPAPSVVIVEGVDSTFANLTWTPGEDCQATLIEYGPPGFTPGTDEVPGPGGAVILAACPPYTLAGLLPETDYDIYIREACTGGGYSNNSCPVSLTTLCSPLPVTQSEDFNTEAICLGICSTPCDLSGSWTNSRADQIDWLVNEGPTDTPGTGPSDDFPGGGRYLYLEGSGACATNSQAILYSNCMQVVAPTGSSCHFSFDYHMYGSAINSLQLDISPDGGQSWTALWSLSGNQGEQWVRQYIDLSAYDGQEAQFRFIGKKGNNIRSDIALDNLIFYGSQDLGAPAYVHYQDLDGDGYGNDDVYFATCSPISPPGFAPVGGDCFDLSAEISPGLPETPCDGFDINCNGMDDEWILPMPLTGADTICSGEFGLVMAVAAYGGTIYWYDVPTGGEPLDSGFFYVPNPPLEQSGATPGVYTFYAAEVNQLGCATEVRGEATITVLPQPALFIPGGQLAPICAGDTVDLSTLIIQDLANSLPVFSFHSAYPPEPGNLIDPPLVNPLFTTTYYVLATADGGCTDVDSFTIQIKNSPIAQIVGSSQICRGGSQVLQIIDVGNGVLPLDFVWSNASNATAIFTLESGPVGSVSTYSATITDANGCRSSDFIDVEVIGSISSVQIQIQNVTVCGGSNGAINFNISGGIAPYEISWSGGASGSAVSPGANYTLTGLGQGSYSATITDNSGVPCPFVVPLTIINGPQAQVSITSVTPVTCSGDMDGCINLQVSGNNPLIEWSTGDTGTSSLCGLEGGVYSVTVTEGACENVLSGIVVQESDSLTGKVSFLKNATCFGAQDGAVVVVAGGGTSPYEYLWSNGSTAPSLPQIGAGVYTVTVTDARGCQLVLGPDEVTEPPALEVMIEQTPVLCTDGAGGSLNALVSGGAVPYGYQWSTGANIPMIENLNSGLYGLTVTDLNGCTFEVQTDLPNPPPLVVEVAQKVLPTCFGVSDGQITLQASGGISPYFYEWSTGDTGPVATMLSAGQYGATITDSSGCTVKLDGIDLDAPNAVSVLSFVAPASCLGAENGQIQLAPQNGQQPFSYDWEDGFSGPFRQNLAAGAYSVTVTDANGCESALVFEVGFNQPITASITAFPPNCANGANGKVLLTPIGGTPFYSYQWNTGQTTKDLIDIPAGAYVCTITDLNGCRLIIDTVLLDNPEPILIELLALDSISCFGMNDGAIDVSVSGGLPPYLFTWNTEDTSEDLFQIGGGAYQLTVEDQLSCAITGPLILVPEPPLLQLSTQVIDEIINCQSNTLDTLFVQISGGSSPFQILWSNGVEEPYLLGLQPGDYSVTVTDVQGCVDSLTSLKIPEPSPFLTVSLSANYPFSGDCANPASAANLKATINGGMAPFQYNWSSGVQGTTSGNMFTLNNLVEDSYKVTVTDSKGCIAISQTVTVTLPGPLNLAVVGSSIGHVDCKFDSTGFIHPIVNGGKPPYQFIWKDQTGMLVGLTKNLDSIPAGIYSLQVVDENGCTAGVSGIQINEPAFALSVNLNVKNLTCFGDNSGNITAFSFGGSPVYTYTWNIPGNSPFLTNLPVGVYSLTLTDSKGCQLTVDTIDVQQPDSPMLLEEVTIWPITCNGLKDGAISVEVLGGTMPYDYVWSNGKLGPTISDLGPGTYKCTIVDANGCQLVTQTYTLLNPPALELVEFVIDTSTFGLFDGALTAVVQGGVLPYEYLWSTGDTTASIDSLFAGNYFLTIVDANGCLLETQVYLPFHIIDGVSEALQGLLQIYPNPAMSEVWIELAGPWACIVWDMRGTAIDRIETRDRHRFDVSSLGGGTYFLQIFAEGKGLAWAKLIVIE